MKFTEHQLEKAFTELLALEGFPHHLGITIDRQVDEVLIEEDLQNFLLAEYASESITVNEVKSIILQLNSSQHLIFMKAIRLLSVFFLPPLPELSPATRKFV